MVAMGFFMKMFCYLVLFNPYIVDLKCNEEGQLYLIEKRLINDGMHASP